MAIVWFLQSVQVETTMSSKVHPLNLPSGFVVV